MLTISGATSLSWPLHAPQALGMKFKKIKIDWIWSWINHSKPKFDLFDPLRILWILWLRAFRAFYWPSASSIAEALQPLEFARMVQKGRGATPGQICGDRMNSFYCFIFKDSQGSLKLYYLRYLDIWIVWGHGCHGYHGCHGSRIRVECVECVNSLHLKIIFHDFSSILAENAEEFGVEIRKWL